MGKVGGKTISKTNFNYVMGKLAHELSTFQLIKLANVK
jgi:hypothetical protein